MKPARMTPAPRYLSISSQRTFRRPASRPGRPRSGPADR
jgi:hypothetical protein